jgi:hypothetical protein
MADRSQFTSWYQTASWKRRRKHQLMIEPMCRMCAKEGKVTVYSQSGNKRKKTALRFPWRRQ